MTIHIAVNEDGSRHQVVGWPGQGWGGRGNYDEHGQCVMVYERVDDLTEGIQGEEGWSCWPGLPGSEQ